jgi:hypothetical protein
MMDGFWWDSPTRREARLARMTSMFTFSSDLKREAMIGFATGTLLP